MADNIKKLSDPFPPQRVSWRVGRVIKPGEASALCYIDARDVMERLDEAVGPGNWQDSYCETPKGRVICNLQVRVGDAWVSKSDGAGDTAVEAEKGALSDAFKRAAVKWGIGRYLYDIPTQYVRIDEKKRILRSETGKLERALPGSRVADDDEPDEPGHGHATNGSKPPAVAEFWQRASYTIPVQKDEHGGSDWVTWAGRMRKAAEQAPDAEKRAKLRQNNAANLAGLKEIAPREFDRISALIDGKPLTNHMQGG